MEETLEIALKYPRGSIKEARVLYEAIEDEKEPSFRAWIYMGKGKINYAEMQTALKGSRDIKSFFEFGDIQGDQDVGPRYKENGDINHRSEINSLADWKAWLEEYVSGLDPLDAFRFYRGSVGPF
jgi:hypothetical protein